MDANAMVLVVDDNPGVVDVVTEWLEEANYTVLGCHSGTDALRIFFERRPDLSIVDIGMPDMDGFEVISRIRELSDKPILVLSALADSVNVVRGLNLGADEYLEKPISQQVFVARVQSLLRRASPEAGPPKKYVDTQLSIDFLTREVRIRDELIHLRPIEYRLLSLLVLNQERVLAHEEMLDRVWGAGQGSPESLRWYLSTLRRKLREVAPSPNLIVNVWGTGYRYMRSGD